MPERLRIRCFSQTYQEICVTQACMGEWHKGNDYSKWKHVWTLESAKIIIMTNCGVGSDFVVRWEMWWYMTNLTLSKKETTSSHTRLQCTKNRGSVLQSGRKNIKKPFFVTMWPFLLLITPFQDVVLQKHLFKELKRCGGLSTPLSPHQVSVFPLQLCQMLRSHWLGGKGGGEWCGVRREIVCVCVYCWRLRDRLTSSCSFRFLLQRSVYASQWNDWL